MKDPCQSPRPLAVSSVCAVEECTCGVLHVTLGMLTIHLHRETLALICETLGEALQRLATSGPTQPGNVVGIGTRRFSTGRPS